MNERKIVVTTARRAIRRALASLAALLLASLTLVGGMSVAQAADYFPGSGRSIVFSDGSRVNLEAIAPPAGADPNFPVWCIDLSMSAPNPSDVVSIGTLTESKMLGPAELDLTTAELAMVLSEHQMSQDADTLAATAYLVHVNLESTSRATELFSDSQSAVNWLVGKITSEAPEIHALAVELAQEARATTASDYVAGAGGEEWSRSGHIDGIGVTNSAGEWLAGRELRVHMSGPAVFAETGTQTWTGQSQAQPMSLDWEATGTGEVTFETEFELTAGEFTVLSNPDAQDTIQLPAPSDPEFTTVAGNTWSVAYDFQPAGVSEVQKLADSGEFTDSFIASAVGDYGAGEWLFFDDSNEYVPVTYRARAFYAGTTPPVGSATIPEGAELIGTEMVVAEGPGEILATFTAEKPGFVTIVWDVVKTDQPEDVQPYIAGDWQDGYGLPEETTSYRHDIEVDSTAMIRETKTGTYLVDDLWVTGFPDDHGDFEGNGRFEADRAVLEQSLYFFAEGEDISDENLDAAELIATVSVPAENGYKASVGSTEFKAVANEDGTLVPGTYVFVTSFDGDDRVKPFTTSVLDVKEQFTVTAQPEIHTTLMYDSGRGKVPGHGMRTLVDVVTYTNLTPGTEYVVTGTLMDKETGEALRDAAGNPVRSTTTFTPKSPNGTVETEFVVDAGLYATKTTVAFERVVEDGREVAVHADLEDENQTLTFDEKPRLETTATDTADGDQVISREGVQSITDRVCDTAGKLVPGVEYEIVTTLMQDNGEPVLDANGHPVTVTTMFTPKSGDDCAEIVIEFDASLVSGNKVVVFEEVFLDGVSVAIHHDLEDTAQTLTFEQAPPVEETPPAEETPPVEPTGASSDLAFTGPDVAGLGIAGLLLAGLGTALVYQGRREKI